MFDGAEWNGLPSDSELMSLAASAYYRVEQLDPICSEFPNDSPRVCANGERPERPGRQ